MTSRIALLLAGAAFLALPAAAQTTGTPSSSNPPSMAQPAPDKDTPSAASSSSSTDSGTSASSSTSDTKTSASDTKPSSDTKVALTEMKPGQWRATKLTGVNVYDNNKAKIGDISELIVNRDGKIEAVVVGVGGFLGMGQHDVAIPFQQVQWVDTPDNSNRAAGSSTPPATSGTGSSNTASGTGSSTTSGTGTRTASNDSAGRNNENRGYPDHAVVNMSKDELKALPEVHYTR